jgi:hypothetical protein
VAEADVGRFGRFWLAALEKVPVPARLDACGCHGLVGGIVEESVRPSSVVFSLEGKLRSSRSGDGGACLRLSHLWGHRLRVALLGDR